MYYLRVVASNRVGFGAPGDTNSFETPSHGYPGSPYQVQAKNVTDASAVICWVPSEIGGPFIGYRIIGFVVNSSTPSIERYITSEQVRNLTSDSKAAEVSFIEPIALIRIVQGKNCRVHQTLAGQCNCTVFP